MLVYSDPDHPENLAVYLPMLRSNKTNDVLVLSERQEGGWGVQPTPSVLPPMAQLPQRSVGALVTKLPQREDAENEARYTAGSELRPIVPTEVRNKDLLKMVLGTLPLAAQAVT